MQVDLDVTAREWDLFVASQPNGHILQTSRWAKLKSEFGWQSERIAVRDGVDLVAGAQVLFLHKIVTIAYVPKGPLVHLGDKKVCQVLFDALHQLCRTRRAIMLKIEPDLSESSPDLVHLSSHGFRPGEQTIQPRRTILIDLIGDDAAILKRMKSKTRYNIRLSERKGVCVRRASQKELSTFHQLMTTTGQRDNFGIRSLGYYERAYEIFEPAGMVQLFLATYEDRPLAGLMAFACGQKAWYMYGASGDEQRARMPNYALQWEAIRWAKARGCHTYDLWGVPDEDADVLEASFAGRSDGLWGVYRFKRGFGGQLVRYAGALDYVYNSSLYWLYHRLLKVRSYL